MKNRMSIGLASLLIFSIVLGCRDKKEDIEPDEVSKFKDKKWLTVSITMSPGYDFDGDGKLETDITKYLLDDCQLDDLVIFSSDQKFTFDEGASKCDPSRPQTAVVGTWTYDNASKVMELHNDDEDEILSFSVVENDGRNLKLSSSSEIDKKEYKEIWHLRHVD